MYHVRNKTVSKAQILKYGRCSAEFSGQKLYLNQSGCDGNNNNNNNNIRYCRDTRDTIRGSSVRLLSSQFKMSRFCMDVSHPLNIDSCIAKRHTSTTRTKQRRRPVDKKENSATLKKPMVDKDGNEEPCEENGYGFVIDQPRLGYENGLYGVGSFGCSYDRHPEDPDDCLDFVEIETLIEQRIHCKLVNDYEMADTIRQELLVMHGVYLYDRRSIWTTRPELLKKMDEMVSDEAEKDHEVILDLNFLNRPRRRR